MKVYTKNGDKGMTSLIGGKKIEKDDIRVEAYGTVDELNSYIGLCYHYLKEDSDKEALRKIQVKLFDIGAELSSPNYKRIKNITKEEDVEELERLVDYYTDKIEINLVILKYINRLSDFLYILARYSEDEIIPVKF